MNMELKELAQTIVQLFSASSSEEHELKKQQLANSGKRPKF